MDDYPPTPHGTVERVRAAVARIRKGAVEDRARLNALRVLIKRCETVLPGVVRDMMQEVAGLQIGKINLLSELNGIAVEFGAPFGTPPLPASAMELHPAYSGPEPELPLPMPLPATGPGEIIGTIDKHGRVVPLRPQDGRWLGSNDDTFDEEDKR